jgi:hypothetical protein
MMADVGYKRKLRNINISTWKIILMMWTGICLNCGLTLAGSGSTITGNFLNGHLWQVLNESQKIIHITGIEEGLLLFLSQIKEDLQIPPELMDAMKESGFFDRRRLLFSCQGVSSIAARMDIFYRDPANLIIPIAEAYQHVTMNLNFATPEDLANNLLKLRRKYK